LRLGISFLETLDERLPGYREKSEENAQKHAVVILLDFHALHRARRGRDRPTKAPSGACCSSIPALRSGFDHVGAFASP
jgi:hypothetical protein